MQSNSLRAIALVSLSLGSLLSPTPAQAPGSKSATALPGAQANDDVGGLPPFLLEVPGGTVVMGLDVEQFVQAMGQATFSMKPEKAHEIAKEKFITSMRRSASILGQQTVDVPTFLLGKWPVKNSEYQVYVDRLRAANQEVRPPFHWWRYGEPKHYESKLADINKAFPKDPLGALFFWERHGHEFPYKVQDEKGNSIGELPVVFISWRDANKFAASLGMRLPTEAELTRAMRGDGKSVWPCDTFGDELLKKLQMFNSRDQVAKPVGTVASAVGPFGHVDMFGQVWQFCGDLGYLPIVGTDGYEKPWTLLQKDKIGQLIGNKPAFRVDRCIAKGGSFLSYQEPVQLLIDARAPMQTNDVLEGAGMRLAKSLKPGYDYIYSLQRVQFSRDVFAKDQDLDLSQQIGTERYTLAANGFPTAYEAVSFAPVNWLVDEKTARLDDLLDASMSNPMLVGGLASSARFDNGVEPGLYAVLYRRMGVPRELSDAIKRGHKEVLKERKAKEKAGDKPEKAEEEEQDPKAEEKNTWRGVITRFGLTEDDIADKKAADGDAGFVRIDGVEVPTDRDTFLLKSQGKVVGVIPGGNVKPASGNEFPAELAIEAGAKKDNKDNAVARLKFGVPILARSPKKVLVLEIQAVLDLAAPTEDKPWRK